MKIEQTNIEQIRTAFQNMQSKEDLLQLLNEVKPLIYGEKTVPFQMKQLTWYSNSKLAKNRYTEFKIKKKSGAERTIHAPVSGLKSIQRTLAFILQCVYEPHHAATGFVRGKSIVDNAQLHVGSKYVYNIDLKDFFPSIDQARFWKCLQLKPFNLIDNSEIIESADDDLVSLGYRITTIKSDGNDEKILIIHYKNICLRNGSFYLKLKAGGGIPYIVFIDKYNSLNGKIRVNISKTNLIPIKDMSGILPEDSIETNNTKIVQIIFSFIQFHYDRKISKNNRNKLANIIASLCCIKSETKRLNKKTEEEEFRYVLPQGAPTSPVISNIICQRLDYLLSAVANRFGLKYSRYADDITFSSMHNVYQPESDFLKELHRIIAEQGFHIKASKTRLQKEGYRKEVTGLVVNDKVNVQKRYIKQLRMWLYYWETYGYERTNSFFTQQYLAEKGNINKGKLDMINVIDGKLNYLKMVKGNDNELYLKLKARFEKLTSRQSFISKVLHIWETNGIESAMELYYAKNGVQTTNNSNGDIEYTSLDVSKFLDNLSI